MHRRDPFRPQRQAAEAELPLAASSAGCAAKGKRGREDEDEGEEDWSAYAMPTTLGWHKLPAATLEMFAEGMACVEEEGAQEKKRRAAARNAAHVLQRASEEAAPSRLQGSASCAVGRGAGRARAQLNATSAVRIFLAKHASAEAMASKSADLSARLALDHGVTAKAVRDIWNKRTWKSATQPYWN